MLSLLAVNYLKPISDDDLFELYVLVVILDVLSDELGFPEPDGLDLLLPGRSELVSYTLGDRTLKVYFDQSLDRIAGRKSEYKMVVDAHSGISGASRRPDITLVTEKGGRKNVLIVEAKRSEDGQYLSDSIYKVFGYLFDWFRYEYDSSSPPRAILVSPMTTRLLRRETNGLGVVLCADSDRALLAESIKNWLV